MTNQAPPPSTLAQKVERLANQCVKCALCLPHCPTYELTQDENESPRGRIALFQALNQKKLPLSARVKEHLDLCLGCRACERVCPAHVEYGSLLTLGRAQLKHLPLAEALPTAPFTTTVLTWLARHPYAQRFVHRFLWTAQKIGLRQLARLIKIPSLLALQPLDQLLPEVAKPLSFKSYYKAIGLKKGSVTLFTGCVTSWCDQETLAASIFMIRSLGYDIRIPSSQQCCGAISLHAGNREEAAQLAKQNTSALIQKDLNIDHIITTATGCHAVLQEYNLHFSSHSDLENKNYAEIAEKVIDVITFIQQCPWPAELIPQPLGLHVALHTPCTRRNVLKSITPPIELLARIPQLTCHNLTSFHCCGAAGTYILEHPHIAKSLVQTILSELNNIDLDYVVTTNIGCAMHIQRELKNQNRSIKVIHPVLLIAQALGFKSASN